MRRLVGFLVVVAVLALGLFTGVARATPLDCDELGALCAEANDAVGYGGAYTGHDEPSLLFYSSVAGSGNSNFYRLQLPTDPKVLPNQSGTAGTWNFQLHPAFWLGMALCDNQSAPEFTHAPCTADSDTNIFDGTDPAGPDYIGKHPGTAFLELQFYPPGWAPWPPGVSCDATKWCAAMAIFSLNQDQNTGTVNNADCLNTVGLEPANFAFITKSGVPHAPPGPLDLTLRLVYAEFGDRPVHELGRRAHDRHPRRRCWADDDGPRSHDGSDGLDDGKRRQRLRPGPVRAELVHLPRGAVHVPPDVLDLERAHACPLGGSQLQRRLLGRDRALRILQRRSPERVATARATVSPVSMTTTPCASALTFSTLVRIGGCIGTDNDFDGVSYQPVWPGTDPNRGQDKKYHPSSVIFTSPLFNLHQNYSRIAFEADLPRIEAADFGGICDRFTGADCVNPPPGSNFYPIYSTANGKDVDSGEAGRRIVRLAARRDRAQGNDEHVRRKLGSRVRAAALQLLPEPQPSRAPPDKQLPQRPQLEPVPRVNG